MTATDLPAIVFVHGAFADSAGRSGVIARRHVRGYTVQDVAISADSMRVLAEWAAAIDAVHATGVSELRGVADLIDGPVTVAS